MWGFIIFFGILEALFGSKKKARYIDVKITKTPDIDPDLEKKINDAGLNFDQNASVYFSDENGNVKEYMFKQKYITYADTSKAHYYPPTGWGLSGGQWTGIHYHTFKYDKKVFVQV